MSVNNVTVNLNVNVNADGEIKVFGASGPTMTNEVIATCKLPVSALYTSDSNGLIEFWEPSTDLGNIYVQLAGKNGSTFAVDGVPTYQLTAKELAKGLQKVLVSKLDASDAAPFDTYTDSRYTECSDFGRLALSTYAHYIFGHVDATAAITNDEVVMANTLSLNGTDSVKDGAFPTDRYNAWKHRVNIVENTHVDTWTVSDADATDAKLALALAKAVVSKGLAGEISAVSPISAAAAAANAALSPPLVVQASTENGTLAEIVRQVIGQDATRAMGQDNNELTPDVRQVLEFKTGDSIYVSITVKTPAVSFSDTPTTSQKFTESQAQDKFTEQKYNIKIELGPSDISDPAPQ
jgi:hypothetical protein